MTASHDGFSKFSRNVKLNDCCILFTPDKTQKSSAMNGGFHLAPNLESICIL